MSDDEAPVDEAQVDEAQVEGEDEDEDTAGIIDAGHQRMSRGLQDFVGSIDRFFLDENFSARPNDSYLRLSPGFSVGEGPRFKFRPRIQGNLRLPQARRRLGLVLSGSSQEDDPGNLQTAAPDDESLAAAIRVFLLDRTTARLSLDAGSRFRPEPDPFARIRLRVLQPVWKVLLRPTQSFFWELDDGLGERSRLDIDIPVTPWSLLRLRGDATYGESTDGVEMTGSIFYTFVLRRRAAWQVRMLMRSETEPAKVVREYRPSVRYRWSMWRPWLFFEIEPRVRFLRQDDWDPAPEAFFRVEMVFGDVRRASGLHALTPPSRSAERGSEESPATDP